MKIFFFFIIVYITTKIFCQDKTNKNTKQTTNSNNNNQKTEEDTNDNPLVFNLLFQELKEEWTKIMPDFVSQYIYLIPVPYKSQVDFYENITKVPCQMRGAFLLEEANSQKDKIEFKIVAPNNTVIYYSYSYGAIFSLNLTDTGVYSILFRNYYMNKEVKPTLIMNSGQNLILEKKEMSNYLKIINIFIFFLFLKQ